MRILILYTLIGVTAGAAVVFALAGGIAEGAVMGAILGGSLGVIIAMRRNAGGRGVSFEYEAAGIPDDNLITTARRNLSRDAYRSSFDVKEIVDQAAINDTGEGQN